MKQAARKRLQARHKGQQSQHRGRPARSHARRQKLAGRRRLTTSNSSRSWEKNETASGRRTTHARNAYRCGSTNLGVNVLGGLGLHIQAPVAVHRLGVCPILHNRSHRVTGAIEKMNQMQERKRVRVLSPVFRCSNHSSPNQTAQPSAGRWRPMRWQPKSR
jgi:hypothetical protein